MPRLFRHSVIFLNTMGYFALLTSQICPEAKNYLALGHRRQKKSKTKSTKTAQSTIGCNAMLRSAFRRFWNHQHHLLADMSTTCKHPWLIFQVSAIIGYHNHTRFSTLVLLSFAVSPLIPLWNTNMSALYNHARPYVENRSSDSTSEVCAVNTCVISITRTKRA